MIFRTMILSFIIAVISGNLLAGESDSLKVPKKALFYSLVLPGSGQVYNGQYIKAAFVISTVGYFSYEAYHNNRLYKDTDNIFNRDERNKYLWWTAGMWLLSGFDAFVDAHLSGFPIDDIEVVPSHNSISLQFRMRF